MTIESSNTLANKKAVIADQFIKEEKYWKNKLAGEITKTFFPHDHGPQPQEGRIAKTFNFNITGELFQRLMKLRNGADPRLHMILAAGMIILLHKMSGSTDILTGSPCLKQEQDINFVNTILVLRNRLNDQTTFKELLLDVRQTMIEAIENQNYPIETLPARLDMEIPGNDDFPLFDVAVLVDNIHDKKYLDGINLNMVFSFSRAEQSIGGAVEYNAARYDETAIQRLVDHYCRIFDVPSTTRIVDIDILSRQEKTQLLEAFNQGRRDYPQAGSLHRLFREQVQRTPGHTALVAQSCVTGETLRLTYEQLDEKAGRLAHRLVQKGAAPNGLIGVMLEPSAEMVIAIWAILKSGAAYLPIAPGNPRQRNAYILNDSAAKILISQAPYIEQLPPRVHDLEIIDAASPGLFTGPEWYHEPAGGSAHLAYGIYTSGTTGTPNCVLVENRGIVNYVHWRITVLDMTPQDAALQMISLSFDAFASNFYPTLLSGGKLVLAENRRILDYAYIDDLIKEESITNFSIVPPVYKLMLDNALAGQFDTLRFVVLGGEKALSSLISFSKQLYPHIEIINEYGPTECSVASAAYRNVTEDKLSVIGKPIHNTQIYILDPRARLQPIGVAGELHIAGAGLARGYLNNPQLTAERFVPLPPAALAPCALRGPLRGERQGAAPPGPPTGVNTDRHVATETTQDTTSPSSPSLLYRTGDLCRWLPDGNIQFLDRIDKQVKIRGFRIELKEIEAQLTALPQVKDAVVITRRDQQVEKYLCAYVVPQKGTTPDTAGLKSELSALLPAYMIPSAFAVIDAVPLTANGKVDYKALPKPELDTTREIVPPRDGVEKQLAGIWASVLGAEAAHIGIDSNFFQMGGHSLKATIMVSRIQKEMDVKIPLAELFKKPVIREIAKFIKTAGKEKNNLIPTGDIREHYPLASAQKRLFLLEELNPQDTVYNTPMMFRLQGSLDPRKLETAFLGLIRRHDSLRTSFHFAGEEPVQRVHDQVPFALRSLPPGSGGAPPDPVQELARFTRPFDLSAAPLLRAGVQTLDEGDHLLLLDMHHIISDGVSMGIVVDELVRLYAGEQLPPLTHQYKDYTLWQQAQKESGRFKTRQEFWLQQFSGDIPVLNLPLDFPRPQVQAFHGGTVDFQIDPGTTRGLKDIALAENASLFMVMLAVYNLFLSKISRQEVCVVGTPTAGRGHADLEHIIGMFVNTLPLKNHPAAEKTFRQFLLEVKENTLGAFENQDYPFEELVEAVDVARDAGRNPIFDTMFNMLNMDIPRIDVQDLTLTGIDHEPGTSKFDLSMHCIEEKNHLSCSLEYAAALFNPAGVRRFASYIETAAKEVARNPELLIGGAGIIPEAEKQRLLSEFNDTAAPIPEVNTLVEMFEAQVEKTPDRPALAEGNNQLSYRQLNRCANRLGHFLRNKGAGPNRIVSIMLERSIHLIVGIMGVLKAGGAYCPIDPNYPAGRVRYMLEDNGGNILLTHDAPTSTIHFDGDIIDVARASRQGEEHNPEIVNKPEDLIYMIYTSGSTGNPKGVMVTMRGFVNLVHWYTGEFNIHEAGNVLLLAPISFDLAQKGLFGALLKGGRLVLAPPGVPDYEQLSAYIAQHNVTLVNCAPSVFYPLVEFNADTGFRRLESVRFATLGGEPIQMEKLLPWLQSPRCRGVAANTYGPTECTDIVASYRIGPEDIAGGNIIPIGKPIPNVEFFVLDDRLRLLPIGVTGELYIAGICVSKGYHRNRQLTAEKFVDIHHVADTPHKPYIAYKTGDLVRRLPDGNIRFIGRTDHQVKIRGFRVETGEIESCLLKHERISGAVVAALKDHTGETNLYAYIVVRQEVSEEQLNHFLAERLPDHMIPAQFTLLDHLPLTPSGKIDRKALPKPGARTAKDILPPGNRLENQLAEIWAPLLGIEKECIGIDDNFFKLGGHSLKATLLTARIHKTFDVHVPMAEIFKHPTIRGLANFLENAGKDRFTAVPRAEKKDYYMLSSAQKRLYVLHCVEPGSTKYNMPMITLLRGNLDRERLAAAFRASIQRHESLRTAFVTVDEEPMQYICDQVQFEPDYCEAPEDELQKIAADFIKPFQLSKAPLVRGKLVKTAEHAHFLLVDMHHIISDGISNGIFVNELGPLYMGKQLPPLDIQYKDFAQWRGSSGEKENIKGRESYWLKRFEGPLPSLKLPFDFERPAGGRFEGRHVTFELGGPETAKLRHIASEEGVTLYMVLFALFVIFLEKISGPECEEDIVVGTPVAGRRHWQLEPVIGMFVNTLAIRTGGSSGKTFVQFLKEVRTGTLEAFDNQDYPFDTLVEQLDVERLPGRNPLFDVLFTLQIATANQWTIPGLTLETREPESKTAKFDLSLLAVELGETLSCSLEYSSSLFKEETIRRFTGYFNDIVASVVKDKEIRTGDIAVRHDLNVGKPVKLEKDFCF